jgi:hypothetical protein
VHNFEKCTLQVVVDCRMRSWEVRSGREGYYRLESQAAQRMHCGWNSVRACTVMREAVRWCDSELARKTASTKRTCV